MSKVLLHYALLLGIHKISDKVQTTVQEDMKITVHGVKKKCAGKTQSVYNEIDYFSSKVGNLEEDLPRKWLEWVTLGLALCYESQEDLELVYICIIIKHLYS